MDETFVCERCKRVLTRSQLKEVMYERGHERVRERLCPRCLDEVMNQSGEVRGIVGKEKAAAVHISPPPT
jgi:hypothetical protein